MAALQLDLLGGFQLRDDAGTVLTLSNKKAKALLAYLSLHAGEWKFNEIHPWKYELLCEVLGGGTGYEVRTEGEFDAALTAAWKSDSLSLIHVHLPEGDCSETLKRLGKRLGERV